MPLTLPRLDGSAIGSHEKSVPSNLAAGLVSAYVELHGRHERIAKELDQLRRPDLDFRAVLRRIKHLAE